MYDGKQYYKEGKKQFNGHDYSPIQHYIRYYFYKSDGLGCLAQPSYPFLILCASFCSVVFVYKSELRLKVRHFILHLPIIKEITALSL
jgi:hypothetical protein